MNLLHPTRWPELVPEFRAAELLAEALEILKGAADRTSSSALMVWNIEQALAASHPVVRDPAAKAEIARLANDALRAQAQAAQPVAASEGADLAAENARLREQLRTLGGTP